MFVEESFRVLREEKAEKIFPNRGRSVGKVALMTAHDISTKVQMLESTKVPVSLFSTMSSAVGARE